MYLSLVQGIVDDARKRGAETSILVEIGDLVATPVSQVMEELRRAADWEVIIKQKRALVQCVCGFFGPPRIIDTLKDRVLFSCPSCGNTPSIIEGDQIVLKAVNV